MVEREDILPLQSDVAGLDKYLQLGLSGRIIRKYIKVASYLPFIWLLSRDFTRGISNSHGWNAGVR